MLRAMATGVQSRVLCWRSWRSAARATAWQRAGQDPTDAVRALAHGVRCARSRSSARDVDAGVDLSPASAVAGPRPVILIAPPARR